MRTPVSGHGWQLTLNGQSQIGPNLPFGLNRNGNGHLASKATPFIQEKYASQLEKSLANPSFVEYK